MRKRIFIVDDEETIRLSLKEALTDQGYNIFTYPHGSGLLEEIEKQNPHLVVLDVRLPDVNGITLLERIKSYDPEIVVIMITAYGDTQSAVNAIKKGAYDYIEKPFDLDEFNIAIKKALETRDLKNEVEILKKKQQEFFRNNKIIGESQAMKKLLKKVAILAESEATILILGETGVGKGLLAKEIHDKSSRMNSSFMDINCGSIPHNLIESELFGFEKNAFTGATSSKKGLFEIADGGTVFLDEVGELPLNIQVKLLKFLEQREFKRVGGLVNKKVDVRIIAATNKDLENEVKKGNFREDLFYRLNVVPVHVPPLRERGDDIILIARFFINHFSKILGKRVTELSAEAGDILKKHTWPGNIRELKNIIERIAIFIDDEETVVRKEHLPIELIEKLNEAGRQFFSVEDKITNDLKAKDFCLETEVKNLEKAYIEKAVRLSGGNKTKAAAMLGISRYALLRRLDKYKVTG
ncbi:MAG: two-component system, NtrC family, response regulator AtoC [Clostridia bacterium]|jgi:two-component system response regulator AtoC|nr:two-component system, NtrC family, response regulator [Clostridiales bacterium]MDK2985885.1 two-component system, NtrC family, response regulator AtoC [Clostridia bacterium]